MTRLSFSNHPFLLGFDQLERLINRMDKGAEDGYPPYNIEQVSENAYRISLALAGFTRDDLNISIEDNQLTVSGSHKSVDKKESTAGESAYLHHGIAARQFERTFVLADGVDVVGANMENGLLHIDLKREEPEKQTRQIEISA